jgi:hypothetical protein
MQTRQPTIGEAINLEHALEFSYSSYHAEAISYLCLFRSTGVTLKAYFFDEGSNDSVVVPHTHRYDFDTRVVAGWLTEVRYAEYAGEVTTRWRYDCIADGGKGFSEDIRARIQESSAEYYSAGESYQNRAHADIHTLREVKPGTILLLAQYADKSPAHTYGWSDTRPACEDKYEKMGVREVLQRIDQLQSALGR